MTLVWTMLLRMLLGTDFSENDASQKKVELGFTLPWILSYAFWLTLIEKGVLSNGVLTNVATEGYSE